jgi:hypothetical protein
MLYSCGVCLYACILEGTHVVVLFNPLWSHFYVNTIVDVLQDVTGIVRVWYCMSAELTFFLSVLYILVINKLQSSSM